MNRRKITSLVLAVLLCATMLPVIPAGASVSVLSAPVGEDFQLTTSPFPDNQIEMWDEWIVYAEHSDPSPDVWAVNINGGDPFPIARAGGAQNNASVHGDVVVYHHAENYFDGSNWDSKEGDIYGYNMATGETFPIAVGLDNDSGNPFVWGDWVAYVNYTDDHGNYVLKSYNMESGVDTTISPDVASTNFKSPTIYGTKCAYSSEGADYGVWVTDLVSGETTYCADVHDNSKRKRSVSIDGDWVAWKEDGNGVWAWNYVSGEATMVVNANYNYGMDMADGIIVYADLRTGDGDDSDGDIYMYDMATSTESVVCTETGWQSRPRISNGAIAWVDHRNDNGTDNPDIYCMYLENKSIAMAGSTRYDTAVDVSQSSFPDGADTVVIATGADWPDALAASALAGALDCPILLVRPTAVPAAVAAEISRLGAWDAYIIGGEGAVSTDVEGYLKAFMSGDVARIAGANRYETAQMVAEMTESILGDDYDGMALLATGKDFPDAVAASAMSAGKGWPLYLTAPDNLPASNVTSMEKIGVTDVYVLGGTGAVSASVMSAVDAKFGDVERLSGATRYDTALAIAEAAVEATMTWDGAGFATGTNFPDALTGGVAQGKAGSVLLLTGSSSLPANVEAKIKDKKDMIGLVRFYGGSGAISDAVKDKITSIVE